MAEHSAAGKIFGGRAEMNAGSGDRRNLRQTPGWRNRESSLLTGVRRWS
jgi:hypothetical protein